MEAKQIIYEENRSKDNGIYEQNIQKEIVYFLRENDFVVFAVPNGLKLHNITKNDPARGQKLGKIKSYLHNQALQGFHAGVTDLIVLKNGITYYVEIKKTNGKLSDNQQAFRDEVVSNGGNYLLFRNSETAIIFFKNIWYRGIREIDWYIVLIVILSIDIIT